MLFSYCIVQKKNILLIFRKGSYILSQDRLICDGDAVISEMVRSGCGLWMSFKDKSYVRLYHLETKENLQEINIGSTVDRMMSGKN